MEAWTCLWKLKTLPKMNKKCNITINFVPQNYFDAINGFYGEKYIYYQLFSEK